MSIWKSIVSVFSGSTIEKSADNLLDKDKGLLVRVGGFVNDLSLSDEERVKYAQKTADAAAKFAVDTLGENTERSKTRRRIAVDWIRVQLFMLISVFVVAAFDAAQAKFLFEIATSEIMFWGTMGVMTFFFGGYYLNGAQLPGLKNKGQK